MGASVAAEQTLRVLFIIGGLGKGGAEKQLMYMLRALQEQGVDLRLITLTGGEYHEQSLQMLGLTPRSLSGLNPAARLAAIVQEAQAARPHFLQASHFFASLYAGAAGRIARIPSIGAIRGDFTHDVSNVGRSAQLLLKLPTVFLANSYNARENALRAGLPAARLHVLHNVIDLSDFDRRAAALPSPLPAANGRIRVTTVARLMPVKRLERFLRGFAAAYREIPALEGLIVGGGPEEATLRALAGELGLLEGGVQFLGERADIPQILAQSDLFALTSQREGFPNVILEAMAASLPVLATPAGECPELVQEGVTGHIVPFDDPAALSARLIELARAPLRRAEMGRAARAFVEARFDYQRLGPALLAFYTAVARQARARSALRALEGLAADLSNPLAEMTGTRNFRG